MKAQELKTKTSAQTLIYKIFLQRYQVYQGRLLASFQDDAKYEHVGQDTRSQGGKDDQDKQGKDLKISDIKIKSKDNDKGSRSKITKHEGTSLQRIQRPRPQDLNDKSNLIDLMKECHNELTSGEITKQEVSGTLSISSKTILVTPTILHGEVTQTLGLVSNFMASQDARLSKFEVDFKQQQSEMTNKIDIVLKAITDRIAVALPREMVKNPKLNINSTTLVLSACFYPIEDSQCSSQIHNLINVVTICPKQPNKPQNEESKGVDREERSNPENINTTPPLLHDPSISFIIKKVCKLDSFLESSGLVPQSSNTKIVCMKVDDGDVMFIEIIRKNEDSLEEGPEDEGSATIEGLEVEYFGTFPTRSELAYHKKLDPKEDTNRGVRNFTRRIKGMHVFIGNFTYVIDFMIVEDIFSIIDHKLSQVVLGKPFVEISNMTHDPPEGVVRLTNETDETIYKMPHKIEQYNSLSNLEKEHTKSVYLRNKEGKRKGVEYVMSKILGFYKECLELGPEYLIGVADDDKFT
ncbi:hypothetical protein Tco_0831784 [Tanacetum coccineum]